MLIRYTFSFIGYTKIVKFNVDLIKKFKVKLIEKYNKKLFGTVGAKIPIGKARNELYYELKNIWYGKAI